MHRSCGQDSQWRTKTTTVPQPQHYSQIVCHDDGYVHSVWDMVPICFDDEVVTVDLREKYLKKMTTINSQPRNDFDFTTGETPSGPSPHTEQTTLKAKWWSWKNPNTKAHLQLKQFYNELDQPVSYVFVYGYDDVPFLMIGEQGCHPFIHTSEFTYLNSDGSGPDEDLISAYNANNNQEHLNFLIEKFRIYFIDFCNDNYH